MELSDHFQLHVSLTMPSNNVGLHQIMYPWNCTYLFQNVYYYFLIFSGLSYSSRDCSVCFRCLVIWRKKKKSHINQNHPHGIYMVFHMLVVSQKLSSSLTFFIAFVVYKTASFFFKPWQVKSYSENGNVMFRIHTKHCTVSIWFSLTLHTSGEKVDFMNLLLNSACSWSEVPASKIMLIYHLFTCSLVHVKLLKCKGFIYSSCSGVCTHQPQH